MKTLLNTWFIACCLIWLIIQATRRFHHPLPYLNNYLSDLAAVPVIADLGLWFQRVFIIRNDNYVLAPGHIIFIVMYLALLFEVVLPRISAVYTSDWIDILLYITGGAFFYKVMNKPLL